MTAECLEGQQRMARTENGHITACKISDANPNELVVSWSGEWIYSFDILRTPDATELITSPSASTGGSGRRVKEQGRKRKRPKSSVLSQEAAERAGSRQRTESSQASVTDVHDGLALRVNYANGQTEEIRIEASESPVSEGEAAALRETDHYRIAKTVLKIQKQMFNLSSSTSAADRPDAHIPKFTSVVGFAASILPEIDDISRTWRYPIDPNAVDVALQNKMRDARATTRRFVQAAGVLSRVLGGRLRTGGNADNTIHQYLATVQPAPSERPLLRQEQFCLDFLNAILLWLDSGIGALIEGFSSRNAQPRRPIPPYSDTDAVDDILIPYLLNLAADRPIVDVDVSRFEADERRLLYGTEVDAVVAFARALRTPFADLTGSTSEVSSPQDAVQERKAALTHWAFKVGRGVLFNAARDVRFAFVDRAFGGLGMADASTRSEERSLREQQEDIDPLEDDDDILDVELPGQWAQRTTDLPRLSTSDIDINFEADALANLSETAPLMSHGSTASATESNAEDIDESEEEEDSDGDIDPIEEEDDDDEDEDVDSDGLSRTRSGRVLWRSDFDRSHMRARVESDIPCTPHTKVYKGHCNVRTVKDVNYFGLQDEYVVSGSDSGHVFIWDRKTSQLLNILEGDNEVVNVVQGHPYEPTMAVSGIDHTIKIFSPDAHDQRNARKGLGVQSADPGFSSLGFGRRRRPRADRTSETSREPPREIPVEREDDSDDDDSVAPHGLSSRRRMHLEYEITSQNELDRKGGGEEAFITRALLAQLAQRIHAHHHAGEGEEGPIVVNSDEDCQVM